MTNKKWEQIQQLQISYDAEADRISFAVGQENISKLWFTRRLIYLIWPKLVDVITDRIDNQVLLDMNLNNNMKLGKNRVIEHTTNLSPMILQTEGAKNEFLVHRFSMDFGQKESVVLHFLDKDEAGVLVQFSNEMLTVFLRVLVQSIKLSGWQNPLEQFSDIDLLTDVSSDNATTLN